ncbi:GH36-type glycosyl hydrolase domain-containing protein [Clostridium formicaceticum]|uniref:Glycosyl transferase n=1 Tax=Clostridium formicaceticum TaxID=1497 RepID=A0AAC9RI29_9CLOT|nr:glucoamylase family protein [Clostridium formicaceticum]AOY75885.1 glycosyl transferase [Clostridium formicaceticum]ARE86227.1 N,N'-diacetylchitobiose phosphorylase [Clostridium formicaceticum]
MFLNKHNGKGEDHKVVDLKDILLTPEELENHAKKIAKNHTVFHESRSLKHLLKRLDQNFERITFIYKSFNEALKHKQDLSPASEWLLDNFYKVEEQVKEVRQNLSEEKFLKLDTLNTGFLEGYPRAYAIALELLSHTEGKLEERTLISFIESYQSQRVLKIAEIWAISLMIRCALMENIRRISEKIYTHHIAWRKAEEVAGLSEEEILVAVKENIQMDERVNAPYVEHLLRVLRREGVEAGAVITYLEKKLKDYNTSVKSLIEEEHREQAAKKVAIGNSITSLNIVATIDWNDIFESLSVVEKILKEDAAGVYRQLDFDSRDYYRNQVEKIAKKLKEPETRVARKAVECSHDADETYEGGKRKHVGFYLLDKGRKTLFESLGHAAVKDSFKNKELSTYLLPIALITICILLGTILYGRQFTAGIGLSILIGLIVLIPASDIAVTFTNWLLTHMFPPTFLPRIEYREGITKENATLVVVPTLLPNKERVEEIMKQMEVFYLANKENYLYFALAGDYKDSDRMDLPEDQAIIDAGTKAAEKLNQKYGKNIFYFFHRQRQFCEKQKKWMGWERKRGALVELNELIKDSKETSYKFISGNIGNLKDIKYVITIDADTQLPIDAAKKLIGIASHPLHKPIIDEEKGRVVEGYGLVQPRIGVNIESTNTSFFTKIFAGRGGIDVYTVANSDVYQDLFGRGIFTGKGIYHIDVFHKVLGEAIPDHTILSHDLLEGSYVGTGLATDFELIDNYPSKYNAYAMRLHRWVRGDWQLIRWLFSKVKNRRGVIVKNPLTALAKWQILDNMRRSLVPIALVLLFVLGMTLFPGSPIFWIGLGLVTIGFPLVLSLFDYLRERHYKAINERLDADIIVGLRASGYQALLTFIFLPYQAYMMGDAILRTLYRVYISKENLLEWVTAADVEKNLQKDQRSFIKRMQSAIVIAVIVFFAILYRQPLHLIYGFPIVILWGMGPWIAFHISKEIEKKEEILEEKEIQQLRRVARKTWAYYEDFAGEENNYLPPDNYQVFPPNELAYRTSPTNIGFLLMAILAARDFGYLSTGKMMDSIEKTITTVEKMDTWRGHLYNWYDTRTLEVLRPYYISTVDSGNFISYLITVKEGIKEYLEKPLIDKNMLQGLADTLTLMEDETTIDPSLLKELLKNEEMNLSEFIDKIENLHQTQEIGECGWKRRFDDMVNDFSKELTMFFPSKDLLNSRRRLSNLENLSLLGLKENYEKILSKIKNKKEDEVVKELMEKLHYVDRKINKANALIERISSMVTAAEFVHLYDFKRHLFSIGYNVDEERLTNAYYDLLASEVRTTSYLAIARREVPKKHWFKLGRAMSIIEGYRGLVSWTGTMFEYFMPYLVMKNYENTLMEESYATAIKAQKRYCQQRKVPWGISESGYYAFDMALNYQYKAFGVPDLGLKRGLSKDMVISPYSTFLALPFASKEAMKNIHELTKEGLEAEYGFYEAMDYTPRKVAENKVGEIVKSFMAHHQGMIFASLDNFLNKNIMQARFHRDPVVRAGEILLQERIPLRMIITKQYKEAVEPLKKEEGSYERMVATYGMPENALPKCHLLSNGRYAVMLTNIGTGYSKMEKLQITRWREDAIHGKDGTHIFIRHLNSDKIWTTAMAPISQEPDAYKVKFLQDKVTFLRTDEDIDTFTEIVVSPEDDVEIRRVTLTNHGNETANIEVTSYFETVMTYQAADVAHPAFSNLFVRTEVLSEHDTLIASRRPREHGQETKWIFHTITVDGETMGGLEYESNRGAFIGRGRNVSNAIGLRQPLSGTAGIVLDPIMSLRKTIKVPAGKAVTISFSTGIHDTREEVIKLAKKYREHSSQQRSFQLAITRSQVEASYSNLKPAEMRIYQEMISSILYLNPIRRKYEDILKRNTKAQSSLWAYGISGDLPIVLVSIKSTEDIDVVGQVLKAHEYWRMKGLSVDLVVLNEDESNYLQPLQQQIHDRVAASQGRYLLDQPGGIFIRSADIIPEEDQVLLYTVARVVIKAEAGPLHTQLDSIKEESTEKAMKIFTKEKQQYLSKEEVLDLDYYNGYGGFSKDGREYIIRLKENLYTPAPWINVVANKNFGFIVSERGSSFTWAENSRENKLTPWSNDPVTDPSGEIVYLRDEETGEVWSITASPIREKESYTISHGLGYSTFRHHSQGILQELTMFVPKEDAIKINLIKLKNSSNSNRKLTLTYYLRPVMGVSDQVTQQHIITEKGENIDAMLIQNPYNSDFPGRIAFAAASEKIDSYTCDRQEFIGFEGSLIHPVALKREGLSNKAGAGYDPCVALQITINLLANTEREIVFLFGQSENIEKVNHMVKQYKSINNSKQALEEVKAYWLQLVDTIQVKTPDLSMNLMLNQWLLYQTISCRIWARSAFYQSGGAYGFRDQLQDAMNMVYPLAEATREQILLHCAHQFVEGDVQHWWHPGAGDKGIRTRFSDDLLWLPFAVVEYLHNTGDYSILEEEVQFLEEEPLREHEDERYGIPRISEEKAPVYEHCIRAIERGLQFGENGIPLMGSGDWNDGMNTVGNKGKGESVWLGWFLYTILNGFSEVCNKMQEEGRSKRYKDFAKQIAEAIEKNAWDGAWYIRAFYDDGSPLGSSQNSECKIDSLAQSWSIISEGGREDRSKRAMEAVEQYLIKRNEGLILLFTPPFDKSEQNPGYIKGYVPGVRENGGQYTHAATWVIKAFAMAGEGDKAWELFNLINPINHTRTHLECATYKLEPYVMAADVYAVSPHTGRGGWSWYTGVSGWMYKVGVESILGLKKNEDKLFIDPCIPKDWQQYEMRYRYKSTYYHIIVKNPNAANHQVKKMQLDGTEVQEGYISLVDDQKTHEVQVIL